MSGGRVVADWSLRKHINCVSLTKRIAVTIAALNGTCSVVHATEKAADKFDSRPYDGW